jgi:hypothetical protein
LDSDDSNDSSYEPDVEIATTSRKRAIKSKTENVKKLKSNTFTTNKCWSIDPPKEILIKIFLHVLKDSIIEIKNINKVCKLWYNVSCDQFLWKNVNLANKKYNYNKFLNFTIDTKRFKFTSLLNLNGQNELNNNDLEMILKQCSNLKSLSISDCKKVKSEILKSIADFCQNLKILDISSFSVGSVFFFFFIWDVVKLFLNVFSVKLCIKMLDICLKN